CPDTPPHWRDSRLLGVQACAIASSCRPRNAKFLVSLASQLWIKPQRPQAGNGLAAPALAEAEETLEAVGEVYAVAVCELERRQTADRHSASGALPPWPSSAIPLMPASQHFAPGELFGLRRGMERSPIRQRLVVAGAPVRERVEQRRLCLADAGDKITRQR